MADPIRRRPPGLTLLALAVGLAAGPLPAQSPGPVEAGGGLPGENRRAGGDCFLGIGKEVAAQGPAVLPFGILLLGVGRPTADGDWLYESESYSPVISRLGAMPFRERWLVAISPIDTSGFPIGAYEITVDLIIGDGAGPIESRRASFTLMAR